MSALLTDLVGRLGERWGAKLALPGAAFVAALLAAVALGHRDALDVGMLASRIDEMATELPELDAGSAIVAAIGFAAAATGVAYLAQAIGSLLEARWFTGRKAKRLGRVLPIDRLARLRGKLAASFSLDLATVWPPVWLHMPELNRQEVVAARTAVRDGATRLGWGLLYLALGAWWWPMALVGAGLLLDGRRRCWTAMDDFARIVEASVQVHALELAVRLGLAETGPLTRSLGFRITAYLQDYRKYEFITRKETEPSGER
ncbi:hypothetical protein GCM10027447_31530 [Glycomyces halotolerans]